MGIWCVISAVRATCIVVSFRRGENRTLPTDLGRWTVRLKRALNELDTFSGIRSMNTRRVSLVLLLLIGHPLYTIGLGLGL